MIYRMNIELVIVNLLSMRELSVFMDYQIIYCRLNNKWIASFARQNLEL